MTTAEVRICAREGCERPLPEDSGPQRRFCTHRCQWYQWRIEHPGEDTDPGARQKALEDVISGYALLTAQGVTNQREIAEALEIEHVTLRQALRRARLAGDPRAGVARPRAVKTSHKGRRVTTKTRRKQP